MSSMKLKMHHWIIVASVLTVIWVGLMAGFSYKYLLEKDPVPIDQWTSDHRTR